MEGIETCPRCGVPAYITAEHLWHPSGFIVQRRDARHILIFMESENLDFLLRELEGILGVSIERIVVDTRRRAAKAYMDRVIPESLKEQVRSGNLDVGPVVQGMVGIGHVLGYGRFEVLDSRLEGDDQDYLLVRVHRPYSITLGCVDPVAAFEALVGREMGLSYDAAGPDTYEIRAFPSPHPEEFKGRLTMRRYAYPEGNIQLEACPRCEAPLLLGEYEWRLEEGLILHRETGRRMVFFAPSVLEAIFGELERELGEAIPGAVVEAQRRLTRDGFYSLAGGDLTEELRTVLSLRGLGGLQHLELGPEGLLLEMENACLHPVLAGLAQGLFEALHGVDSRVEWEAGEGGGLRVKVSA
ncbi:hypothetical protein [Candidatus Solincola tengchongensis]|uniref:hypothetical protein n=1 Tax=Candidatus Solincola tengchongensis TaxID=2900693 RepID=UPI00257CF07A|nr:hypothetical protein [Candidatus Solincola tengchongensis]